jgi:putative endonuclease
MKSYFVYIMSNKSRRLYTGITSTLGQRVYQHKNKVLPGFTARYKFDMLVYFEEYSHVMDAIAREKEIKRWRREKKLKLILAENPNWADLSAEWEEDPSWRAISSEEMRPMLKRRVVDPLTGAEQIPHPPQVLSQQTMITLQGARFGMTALYSNCGSSVFQRFWFAL